MWKTEATTHSTHDAGALAAAARWKPHIRWIPTYSDSLRAILDNSKDNAWTIAELLEWSTQPAEKCNCREIALLNPDILDPYTQHVRTASLSKVLYAASKQHRYAVKERQMFRTMRTWLQKGRGYRPGFINPKDPARIWKSTHTSFAASMRAAMKVADNFPQHSTTRLKWQHNRVPRGWRWIARPHSQCNPHGLRSCKAWIQRHLTVTTVDKSSKNFAFVCKWFYRWTLWTRLNSEGEMVRIPTDGRTETAAELAKSVSKKTACIIGTPSTDDGGKIPMFPSLIGSVKMKKILDNSKTDKEKASIDTWRFITTANEGPVKPACRIHAIIGSKLDSVYYSHCLRVCKRWTRQLPKQLKGRKVRAYRQAKDIAHLVQCPTKSLHNPQW